MTNKTEIVKLLLKKRHIPPPNKKKKKKRIYFNDCLSKKIVRLAGELLTHFRLKVVIFVPDTNFDPIRRIVTLTVEVDRIGI